ncbi:MAG: amidohydrolase family protein, partial [Deltaproteobacteria bacterium]|nr:amidohydrolase family protein [Deltaproteobacteria bacterium]
MAMNGFKVFDSDMHIMEPPDLWERYMASEFRSMAPRGVTSENVRDLRIAFPGETSNFRTTGASQRPGHNYERNQSLYRDHAARGWSGEVQLEAMDLEGLDVAVMFPSRGLSVLVGRDGTGRTSDPRFAAAIARAYNDWLYEFCQTDPQRMLGAGMISVYDIKDAVEETHRVVKDYGFNSVFLRSNIVNGKPWHDPYYEPLWN